jgi:hypothetical protein
MGFAVQIYTGDTSALRYRHDYPLLDGIRLLSPRNMIILHPDVNERP